VLTLQYNIQSTSLLQFSLTHTAHTGHSSLASHRSSRTGRQPNVTPASAAQQNHSLVTVTNCATVEVIRTSLTRKRHTISLLQYLSSIYLMIKTASVLPILFNQCCFSLSSFFQTNISVTFITCSNSFSALQPALNWVSFYFKNL